MKVNKVIENEDGSAIIEVELTNEEVKLLLENSIVQAIKNYIESKETK